ncbi:hypothetical protein J6590_049677 [Homalodisca vitripennis]|nr:hypothetical protein J6590_049677 [Homalodisca vitripennis]
MQYKLFKSGKEHIWYGLALAYCIRMPVSRFATIAEIIPIRYREICSVRRGIVINSCRQLLTFESDSVDLLANEILIEDYTRGGGKSRKKQMKIFLPFLRDTFLVIGFQTDIGQDMAFPEVQLTRLSAMLWIESFINRIIGSKFPMTPELHGDKSAGNVLQVPMCKPSVMILQNSQVLALSDTNGVRDARSVLAGDPTVVLAGDPTVVIAGDPTVVVAGDPTVVVAGDPTVVKAVDPTVVLVDQSDKQKHPGVPTMGNTCGATT